jgi:hypothetical protein
MCKQTDVASVQALPSLTPETEAQSSMPQSATPSYLPSPVQSTKPSLVQTSSLSPEPTYSYSTLASYYLFHLTEQMHNTEPVDKDDKVKKNDKIRNKQPKSLPAFSTLSQSTSTDFPSASPAPEYAYSMAKKAPTSIYSLSNTPFDETIPAMRGKQKALYMMRPPNKKGEERQRRPVRVKTATAESSAPSNMRNTRRMHWLSRNRVHP